MGLGWKQFSHKSKVCCLSCSLVKPNETKHRRRIACWCMRCAHSPCALCGVWQNRGGVPTPFFSSFRVALPINGCAGRGGGDKTLLTTSQQVTCSSCCCRIVILIPCHKFRMIRMFFVRVFFLSSIVFFCSLSVHQHLLMFS